MLCVPPEPESPMRGHSGQSQASVERCLKPVFADDPESSFGIAHTPVLFEAHEPLLARLVSAIGTSRACDDDQVWLSEIDVVDRSL